MRPQCVYYPWSYSAHSKVEHEEEMLQATGILVRYDVLQGCPITWLKLVHPERQAIVPHHWCHKTTTLEKHWGTLDAIWANYTLSDFIMMKSLWMACTNCFLFWEISGISVQPWCFLHLLCEYKAGLAASLLLCIRYMYNAKTYSYID